MPRPAPLPRAVVRVAAVKAIAAAQLARIVQRLRAGDSKQAIHRDERLSYERVDAVAAALGWRRDWLAASVWDHRRSCALDAGEILARFDRGETLQSIGDRAGITRERVRQIVRDSGRTARRIAQRPLRERRRREQERERAQRAVARAQAAVRRRRAALRRLAARLKRADALWRAGRTIAAIAKAYRLPPTSMAWYIFIARQRLGPAWFPRRIAARRKGR